MKRLHIHLKTQDLDKTVGFYTAMFGKEPDRIEADYAKWLLDDPRAHVSVSSHGGAPGVDHAGISVVTREDLDEIAERLRARGDALMEETETTCCYAKSNKYWARDPQGAVWELFQTFDTSETYGAEPDRDILTEHQAAKDTSEACCTPQSPS